MYRYTLRVINIFISEDKLNNFISSYASCVTSHFLLNVLIKMSFLKSFLMTISKKLQVFSYPLDIVITLRVLISSPQLIETCFTQNALRVIRGREGRREGGGEVPTGGVYVEAPPMKDCLIQRHNFSIFKSYKLQRNAVPVT